MATDNVKPIRSKLPAGPRLTQKKLTELLAELGHAQSALFVAVQALDTGDERTDLELHAAATLRPAFEALDAVCEDLVSLREELPEGEAQP